MQLRFVHIALPLVAVLMVGVWAVGKLKQASVAQALSAPAAPTASPAAVASPSTMPASIPQADAYQSRLAFEAQAKAFVRDAPKLDDKTRIRRAQALSREIDRREAAGEFSADEAVLLRIGLIHAAIEDERERIRQAQEVVDRYRQQSAERKEAYLEQQRRDAKYQEYKAAEARIVAETMKMTQFPGGMSRDDYLRVRLQQARETIYNTTDPATTP